MASSGLRALPTRRAARWSLILPSLALLCCLCQPLAAQAAGQPQPSAAELRVQVRFAILDENYPQALIYLDQLLVLQPDNRELIEYKVRALRNTGGNEKALEYMRTLWARDAKGFAYLRFLAADMRVADKQYDKALVHLKQAEQVDAQRAIQEEGRIYLAQKKHDQALASFGRLDQHKASTWMLVGQAQFNRQDYAAAQEAFKKGLLANPTPEETAQINQALHQSEAAQKANRPWRAYTTLLAQYEDNVFRDPLQSYPGAQPTRKKGDFSYLFKQDMQYDLHRWDRLTWGLSGQLQYMGYLNLHDANFAAWSLGTYLFWQGPNWGLRLPYDYSYYWATGNFSRRLYINTLAPSFTWQHTPNLRSEVYGLVQHRSYLNNGEPNYWRWRVGVTHFLSKDPRLLPHLRLGYAFNQETASDEVSGFNNYEISLGGAVPLAKSLSLDVSGTYLHYNFDRRTDPYLLGKGNALVDRRDEQYQAAAQIFYRPEGKAWQVALGYYFTFNDSDIQDTTGFDPYDFKKNTLMLMFMWSW